MSGEFELFGLDSWKSWLRRNKGHEFVPAPGQKCLNCDTELKGQYCFHCGQDADTHHRTIPHLLFEAFEGLFHLDGRLWTTFPPLLFTPGKLARDLMEGRVARHVPPFRIFLIALLVLMAVAEHQTEEARLHPRPAPEVQMPGIVGLSVTPDKPSPPAVAASASASDEASDAASDDGSDFTETLDHHAGELQSDRMTRTVDKKTGEVTVTHNINPLNLTDDDSKMVGGWVAKSHIKPDWLKADLIRALENKERFFASIFTWGHRLALLLLPIVGLTLALLYIGKRKDGRRLYLYDHLIVSMNLLSFIFFTNAIGLLLPEGVKGGWSLIAFAWTFWVFFSTLRGAYGSSIPGAIIKSLILWTLTGFAFALLIAGVIFISLTVG